jgi:hypothetical protein
MLLEELTFRGIGQFTVMEANPEQDPKAPLPIEVTDEGMIIDVKTLQSKKALLPIEATVEGMFTEVKLWQDPKA